MYSNSKRKPGKTPSRPLKRQGSGEFDDFNTVARQSRRLKYRGPKDASDREASRSASRRQPRLPRAQVKDFYEKLSREFEERGSDRSGLSGQPATDFQSQWRQPSRRGARVTRRKAAQGGARPKPGAVKRALQVGAGAAEGGTQKGVPGHQVG